jgi:hypothetical protein
MSKENPSVIDNIQRSYDELRKECHERIRERCLDFLGMKVAAMYNGSHKDPQGGRFDSLDGLWITLQGNGQTVRLYFDKEGPIAIFRPGKPPKKKDRDPVPSHIDMTGAFLADCVTDTPDGNIMLVFDKGEKGKRHGLSFTDDGYVRGPIQLEIGGQTESAPSRVIMSNTQSDKAVA